MTNGPAAHQTARVMSQFWLANRRGHFQKDFKHLGPKTCIALRLKRPKESVDRVDGWMGEMS